MFILFLLIVSCCSFWSGVSATTTTNAAKSSVVDMDINTDIMAKKYTKTARLSPDSADQKVANQKVEKNKEKFSQKTLNHLEELNLCKKAGNYNDIKNCRQQVFNKAKK